MTDGYLALHEVPTSQGEEHRTHDLDMHYTDRESLLDSPARDVRSSIDDCSRIQVVGRTAFTGYLLLVKGVVAFACLESVAGVVWQVVLGSMPLEASGVAA